MIIGKNLLKMLSRGYMGGMTLAEKIEARLVQKGWKQVELHSRSAIPQGTLSNILQRSACTAATGVRLAKALGVTADWLLDDERDWPPDESQPSSDPRVETLLRRFPHHMGLLATFSPERGLAAAVNVCKLDAFAYANRLTEADVHTFRRALRDLEDLAKKFQTAEYSRSMIEDAVREGADVDFVRFFVTPLPIPDFYPPALKQSGPEISTGGESRVPRLQGRGRKGKLRRRGDREGSESDRGK